jgi:cobalt-zinc-cadmium efflux system membrane fusion protein
MKKIIIALILPFLVFACGSKSEKVENTEPTLQNNLVQLTNAQAKSAGISIGKTSMKSISEVLKLNGKIDVPPQNLISVSVPLGGYLKSTEMLPGMKVTKGQLIAIIEDQQFIQIQEDFLTTKEQLSLAENEYNRQKELNQNKATSDKVFQQSQAEYRSKRIAVNALAEKLRLIGINPQNLRENNISRNIRITSPITGFVSKVNVNIGKYLNPADVLFELIDPCDIHLNLNVYEKDLEKLSIGQNLTAFTNNQTDQKYPCKILLISRNLSAERSGEVHCHFDRYDERLLPGMYMNAEIDVQNNFTQALPESAIVTFGEKSFVFIGKEKNLFEMREVEVGETENGFTHIITPLENQKIVMTGAYSLLMQLKNKE